MTDHAGKAAAAQAAAARRVRVAARGPTGSDAERDGTYAGLMTRTIAYVLDAAAINLVALLVGIAAALALSIFRLPQTLESAVAAVLAVLYVVWAIGYFVAFWSTTGQTPGSRVMRIRVIDPHGAPRLTPRRALVRVAGLVLATIPLFAGFLMMLWDRRRRCLQDRLARTVVVHAPARSRVVGRRARPTGRGMSVSTMRAVELPSGETIPVLGMGTWHLAERRHPPELEIEALRTGLDLGMTLVDTAEMYGDGASERLIGRAIAGRRDEVFLVSKVLPHHATADGTISACEASLRRLGTDRLDLYLLHWRGAVPLEETIGAFEELRRAGLIRHWGVSNFDLSDMMELIGLPEGRAVQTDEVLYNLTRRGIEWNLLPWCEENGLPIVAYSPIEQGRLLGHPALGAIAARHKATPAQVALAWVISHPGVCAIPEAGTPEHVRENVAALNVVLGQDDVAELDAAFPRPPHPVPLELL